MTFLTRRTGAVLCLAATVLASLAIAIPAGHAATGGTPTLQLRSASSRITLYRYGRQVPLQLGVWLGSVGADFELRVSRADYESPLEVVQVDAETGETLNVIPSNLLARWRGLRRFAQVTFTDLSGETILDKSFRFCPNAYERQRVNDEGPQVSRYPTSCGSYSPFTKGMVWGIDNGWATSLTGGEYDARSVNVPAGRYTVTVRVADEYAELFDIPAEAASVTLDVTVKSRTFRYIYDRKAGADSAASPAPQQAVPTITEPDPSTLPDLEALPTWSIETYSRHGRDLLAFAATPWNAGPRALVVEGFRRQGENVMDAYQYFYDAAGNVVGRAPVGELKYHSGGGHNHWHFLQFASYKLIDASDDELVRSKKQAFCIVPTDAIDLTVDGANWTPWSTGLGSACGSQDSIWVREELDAGWGDTYYQYTGGQALDITTVPNGWYEVVAEVNPLANLYDADPENNVATRLVYLGGRPGNRRALVAPWQGIQA